MRKRAEHLTNLLIANVLVNSGPEQAAGVVRWKTLETIAGSRKNAQEILSSLEEAGTLSYEAGPTQVSYRFWRGGYGR